jgi:ABC-type glutathione transport system ATPase component
MGDAGSGKTTMAAILVRALRQLKGVDIVVKDDTPMNISVKDVDRRIESLQQSGCKIEIETQFQRLK